MMARLVTLYILTDHAGNIGHLPVDTLFGGEQLVDSSLKLILTSKQLHHAIYIVRNKIAVLPCGSLGIGASRGKGIEGDSQLPSDRLPLKNVVSPSNTLI